MQMSILSLEAFMLEVIIGKRTVINPENERKDCQFPGSRPPLFLLHRDIEWPEWQQG